MLDISDKYLIQSALMSDVPDGFSPLRIKQVVRETRDAVSLVLDVPDRDAHRFGYRAGQFVTICVEVGGDRHRRCYSMSSAPEAGGDLQITIKRDPGGLVSNWLNDTAVPGAEIHATPPEGRFVLNGNGADIVAFAGGSGITPIFSLIKSVLMGTGRRVRLFYANRSRDAVIFERALSALVDVHGDRLQVVHHFDDERGVVSPDVVGSVISEVDDVDYYVCGPGPFMDTVEEVLQGAGIPGERVHLERFALAEAVSGDIATETQQVTIELDRRTTTMKYRQGDTLLQCARSAGLRAPYSCEIGSCGTCMARVVEGSARMVNNDALEDDEVAEGWILTCQSLPTSKTVRVVYE